ncbi:MAG: hypothetical protein WDO19_27785 [Bacteroidota bacterium]
MIVFMQMVIASTRYGGNNLVGGQVRSGMATPEIMAPGLKNDVPEIEQVSRISWGQDYLLSVNDKKLKGHWELRGFFFSQHIQLSTCKRKGKDGIK